MMEGGQDGDAITMQEYLEREQQLEKEALEAYPGKFDHCTYEEGYLRQPLWTCRTCQLTEGRHGSAICYSCSLVCHPTCDLVELGGRRHFRCDCGNSLFANGTCSLMPVKDSVNEENDYDRCAQNFQGRFCSCHQPYDGVAGGDMTQCIVCEDWFHLQCLQLAEEEQARIAGRGAEVIEEGDPDEPIDVVSPVASREEVESVDDETTLICRDCVSKYPLLGSLKEEDSSKACLDPNSTSLERALLLPAGWRQTRLCKCEGCQDLLRAAGLQYLTQPEPLYEPEPDHVPGSSYEAGMRLLEDQVNRKWSIEGIKAIDTLKDRLLRYLQVISQEGRAVTKEDIETFFASINK